MFIYLLLCLFIYLFVMFNDFTGYYFLNLIVIHEIELIFIASVLGDVTGPGTNQYSIYCLQLSVIDDRR